MGEVEETRRVLEGLQTALGEVSNGNLAIGLKTTLPEEHPVGALVASMNGMTEVLRAVREKNSANEQRLQEQIETINAQRNAIRELSTPVIEVLPSVLCVPIVGTLDSGRASELTQSLLDAVVTHQAKYAVIDITGIEVMDTGTCDYFLRMVRSVAMLGSECVLSGINPTIASTIVQMGSDLTGVSSFRSLRHALKALVYKDMRTRQGGPKSASA